MRVLLLAPVLLLAACGHTDAAEPCPAPPLVHCWRVQLDPNSSRVTRVCADPDDAQPVGWWRA